MKMSTQTVESKNEITYEQKEKNENPKNDIIFWALSCISWILLILTGWIAIKWLDDKDYFCHLDNIRRTKLRKLLLFTFSNACLNIIYSFYFIYDYNFIRIYFILY